MVTRREAVGAHYGLKDWLLQRLTAVLMAAYTLLLLGIVLWNGGFDYALWRALFAQRRIQARDRSCSWSRSSITRGSACATSTWTTSSRSRVRLALQCLSVAVLIAYLGWTIQILWGAR